MAREVFVLAALVCLTATVSAQEAASPADVRIAQGEALFAAGNYDASLAEFEQAYQLLESTPYRYILLWNIGQCHERLFRYDRALEYYRRYLDEGGPEAEDRGTVEATMRALDGLLGTVHLETNVEGAEVWVDDVLVGTAPADIRVTGGRHTIELRAPEYLAGRREIQIAARGNLSESIVLEVITDSRIEPTWAVLSGAIAVAAAGVGIGFWVFAQDQWNGTRGIDLGDGARERIAQSQLTGDLLMGTAGLFAVTAVVLGFFTRWEGDGADVRALLVPTPDGVVLSVGGSF